MVADHVAGRDVGQDRHAHAAPAVLLHGDDGGGGRPAFGHHVEDEFDRRTDGDGAREDRMGRAHRLVLKSFRHGDDRLREDLSPFHDLPGVLSGGEGDTGVTGEPVGPVGLHVEPIEQALHRPPGLFRRPPEAVVINALTLLTAGVTASVTL